MADVFDFVRKKLFGPKSKRELKKIQPLVGRINELEDKMRKLSDDELRAKTGQFRQRFDNGEGLDSLLPEAFATCREASRRVLGMRHFDVQLLGGMILHKGSIAEMRTGEGKTLVATLPSYLNAIEGRGVHVVTVNDYLARRDAEWMGRLHKFLGLQVGVIVHGLTDEERQDSYRCDITYGTNSEFGFDYLRDNMKPSIERYVQRELRYAIVDEVDSILIDEARTPLIISGRPEQSKDFYYRVNQVIPALKKDVDYTVDEKAHSAMLTDAGVEKVEKKLGLANLYEAENIEWNHHVQQALRAHSLYKRDVNYVVEDSKVIIIDEFTGRKMPGRRWSDGLHQAIEAKENVTIEEETQTLATVTYQNFFRMYGKLSGMTGTAETEAEEFTQIYRLGVVVVPTNLPMIREDNSDLVYKNERGKFRHVIDEIVECNERGQPVLVGTVSVEKSEVLAMMLKKKGIAHTVLNAKQHAREALIVAQAGRKGVVTISTNMAGRGTDIILGGNAEAMAKAEIDPEKEPEKYQELLAKYKTQCLAERQEVLNAGGLHILGTERHESRRIDNQLRGRAGRQGDPGSSRFYLSLEDDLLRIFGAERMTGLMERLGMEEDVPIEHGMVNNAIANAQKKVEGHNFDIRKNLLEYDDVMNQQRMTLYALRRQVLEGRYNRELSPDEKKRGVIPETPIVSGDMTIEKLGDQVRPQLTQIVDAWEKAREVEEGPYRKDGRSAEEMEAAQKNEKEKEAASAAAGTSSEGDAKKPNGANGAAAVSGSGTSEDKKRKAARRLKHEIYKYFGAVVELEDVVDDRSKIIELASHEAAASLIQQRERVLDLFDHVVGTLLDEACPVRAHADEYRLDDLEVGLKEQFGIEVGLKEVAVDRDKLGEKIWAEVEKMLQTKELELSPLGFLYFARHLFLEEIDAQWIDHLKSMDHLREGVGLVGYGQKDPKQEYKMEGFNMFVAMMARIQANVVSKLSRLRRLSKEEQTAQAQGRARAAAAAIAAQQQKAGGAAAPAASNGANGAAKEAPAAAGAAKSGNGAATAESQKQAGGASGAAAVLTSLPEFKHKEMRTVETGGGDTSQGAAASGDGGAAKPKQIVRDQPKVGRNDPCPCGSGKKYKKCHGLGATL